MSTAPKYGGPLPVRLPGVLVAALATVLAAALALVVATSTGARAADGLDRAAANLRQGPVYVDPRSAGELHGNEARALADTIEKADVPVFVAVLPDAAEFDKATLFQDLRTKVGITGAYVVALGDDFSARADSSVMSRAEVANLAGAVERSDPGDVQAMVTGFTDQAVQQAEGTAPASWEGADGGPDAGGLGAGGLAVLTGLVALLALTVGGSLFVKARSRRQRRAEWERQQLATLRPVVDEDITAFGEELDRIDISPQTAGMDDAMREDYASALDSYEKAKAMMADARRPGEVRKVTRALEEGRFSLATLDARRSGKPLPERRTPCFFDPRHGPAAEDALWAPEGGTERTVPVCAADAVRLADGAEPMAREVETPSGRRPYWEAGPVYGPWAYGYFGGGLLPGLLMGTMLGSAIGPYGYGADAAGAYGGGEGGDYGGGDMSGSDFEPGDFGGGFGDFGGGFGGGGDFGGGF
ncbi:hypothetical protein LHJ74_03020 [Streptomyces sp. N2-109]|uniref:TPM domain-containing protein n=1 Tax=Streptomyces gossypii TaxID=2883101 RepID=A0ABT2JM05_9ACTN|nr:hypothetical protein [Streptomyces gossypii]MCT2588915.1 hypothetical protein [Streptomyces gossypii]